MQPPLDPPVFVISIDTLRADRLGVYGYPKASTPAIDRFRRDAILFERAWSHCPLTLPSHSSILTGLLPFRHGVRDNSGYVLRDHPTLASLLRDRGYDTGAAVSSYVLRSTSGISHGFTFFDDTMDGRAGERVADEERNGDETRLALTAWLAAQRSRRVFGLLHLFEPHAPYEAPQEYLRGRDPYDAEVAWADAIVGRFLDDLQKRGLYDDAIVVILSDHGEGLGDHGEDEHGVFLYREAIQVPLMIKLPKNERAGESVAGNASLADLVPTILARIGMTSPSGLDGIDILGSPLPGRRIYAESYFPRLHFGWSELVSLVDDRYHYIDAPRSELFDLAMDRAERKNLLASNRRVAFAMKEELAGTERAFQPPAAVDPEDRRKLAALGYLGTSSVQSGAGPLPDPKDRIGVIRELKSALILQKSGHDQDAIETLQRIVRESPRTVDAWALLAESYRRLKRPEDALAMLRRGLGHFPSHSGLLLSAAGLLLEMDRLDEAAQHAEVALGDDETGAREMLAKIAMRQGDLDGAERQLLGSSTEPESRLTTLLLLAQVYAKQGRQTDRLRVLERATAIVRERRLDPIPRLHFERAEALLELRRVSAAEVAFRAETEAFPENLEAWGGLAIVLGAQGRIEESREVLAESIRRNPGAAARRTAEETLGVLGDAAGARALRASGGNTPTP